MSTARVFDEEGHELRRGVRVEVRARGSASSAGLDGATGVVALVCRQAHTGLGWVRVGLGDGNFTWLWATELHALEVAA